MWSRERYYYIACLSHIKYSLNPQRAANDKNLIDVASEWTNSKKIKAENKPNDTNLFIGEFWSRRFKQYNIQCMRTPKTL